MKENLSPAESLVLIQSMIEKTKENISENRFYFLLWGWVIFLALVVQFVLKTVFYYEHHYAVWLITLPTWIATMLFRNRKSGPKYRSWIGESMGYFWMGLGISFFVLCFILSNIPNGWLNSFPFFILFYGLGTFVSGKILSFRPLMIGGIINWVLAGASVLVSYDNQMLLTALAILCSYIVPGHLIKSEKQNKVYAA